MAIVRQSFSIPYNSPLVDRGGFLTEAWAAFFRSLYDRVYTLGSEQYAPIENNVSTPKDIEGLKVNARGVSSAFVFYLVQRITTGSGATALFESGILNLTYLADEEKWALEAISEESPDDAGITFSITDDGQVQYESSNVSGDPKLSRIFYRVFTVSGKSALYSSVGVR